MFKYISLMVLFGNFFVLNASLYRDNGSCPVEMAITLGKKLESDFKLVEEKSEQYAKDSCASSVYQFISPQIQEVLEEHKEITELSKSNSNLQELINLKDKATQNLAKIKKLMPDLNYLQIHNSEN